MNRKQLVIRHVVAVAIVLVAGLGPLAHATHGVEHRYTIFGQVVDKNGAPVGNSSIRITGLGGKPLGNATTAADGQYSVLLHVHDRELGKAFWVTANGLTKGGTISFDIADRKTDRTHRLDFNLSESG